MLTGLRNLWQKLAGKPQEMVSFPELFESFQRLLQDHQQVMEIIADLGEKSGGDYVFDRQYLNDSVARLRTKLTRLVTGLNLISANRYVDLYATLERIHLPLEAEVRGRLNISEEMPFVVALKAAPLDYPDLVGGKAGNLMSVNQQLDLPVPAGFVITTRAYRRFVEHNQIDSHIHSLFDGYLSNKIDVLQASRQIQYALLAGVMPQEIVRETKRYLEGQPFWAVRSSAYGEDGELSFAGLHESFLQVPAAGVLEAVKKVWASLFSPEALVYRRQMGMLQEEAAMAALVQEIVSSRASGVIHSLDLSMPDSDFLVIYAHLGLGRTVVEGKTALDVFTVARQRPFLLKSARNCRQNELPPACSGRRRRGGDGCGRRTN